MDDVSIRAAGPGDLAAVAELRWWQHTRERQRPAGVTHEEFLAAYLAWARCNEASHHCLVLLRGGAVIGAAWLAVTGRPPYPGATDRAAGDVQNVYVLPEARNAGLGGRLIDALLALARDLGLERVTVHSSERAVPMYRRHGFARSPHLLQADLPDPR